MYTVTTDTGLSFDNPDPIDLGEALLAELTAHGAHRPIAYSITRDGTPQQDGSIDVHNTDHDSTAFLTSCVKEVIDAMIIQAAYDAHAFKAAE